MFTLWAVSGGKNLVQMYDRKCSIYRAVGPQRFVDTLFDADDSLSLVCLEALALISSGKLLFHQLFRLHTNK
jgi:hypothetical protein